jgi:hypothetical protein
MDGTVIRDMVLRNTEKPLKNGAYATITVKVFDYSLTSKNYSN